MTRLDLGNQNALRRLECADNALTSLELSGCPELEYLDCSSNRLTELNASICRLLNYLNCDDNALEKLTFDGWAALTSLYCGGNRLTNLNVTACEKLTGLNCSENRLKHLELDNCPALEIAYCGENQLTVLNVSGCGNLTVLDCGQNQLTRLNVDECTALEWLYCERNQLTALDVSENARLSLLICYGNAIPSLDITNCSALRKAWKNPKEETRDGYKTVYTGEPYNWFGSYGTVIDRTAALTANGKCLYGTLSLADALVTVPYQTWTGRKLTPVPTVTLYGAALVYDVDFTVTDYKNSKNIGTATVTIAGKGVYTGTAKADFDINPKGTKLSKPTAGKKKATVKWKKQKNVTGYQIEYSLNEDFSGGKRSTVRKAGTTKKVIKKLKGGKKYYLRVRTYKKVGRKYYYSAWSNVKAVRVKK